MNQYIHTSTNHKQDRLLLFFAGWGMDERPFIQYTPRESDFMICYDYHTLDFDTSPLPFSLINSPSFRKDTALA